MTLSIVLSGDEYTGFTQAQATRGIDIAAGSFTFTATAQKNNFLPVREGDLVEIYADSKHKIITGWIDEYGVKYDADTHTIQIKGRSITQDFIDCSVPAIASWEKLSLFQIAKFLAKRFNLKVIDQANETEPFIGVFARELGQTAFEFLEKFTRQRNVFITDNPSGNIVLFKPTYELFPFALQNIVGKEGNNIISADRVVNLADLFGEYIAQVQSYPVSGTEYESVKDMLKFVDSVIDPEIRSTRVYEFFAEEVVNVTNIDQDKILKNRAEWEKSNRRAKNFKFEVTVSGHTVKDELFVENRLYQIDDDFINIYGQFYCNRIMYNDSVQGGSTSTLNLVNKNTYTLESEKDRIILIGNN